MTGFHRRQGYSRAQRRWPSSIRSASLVHLRALYRQGVGATKKFYSVFHSPSSGQNKKPAETSAGFTSSRFPLSVVLATAFPFKASWRVSDLSHLRQSPAGLHSDQFAGTRTPFHLTDAESSPMLQGPTKTAYLIFGLIIQPTIDFRQQKFNIFVTIEKWALRDSLLFFLFIQLPGRHHGDFQGLAEFVHDETVVLQTYAPRISQPFLSAPARRSLPAA